MNVSADNTKLLAGLHTGDDEMDFTAVELHSTSLDIKWKVSVKLRYKQKIPYK